MKLSTAGSVGVLGPLAAAAPEGFGTARAAELLVEAVHKLVFDSVALGGGGREGIIAGLVAVRSRMTLSEREYCAAASHLSDLTHAQLVPKPSGAA